MCRSIAKDALHGCNAYLLGMYAMRICTACRHCTFATRLHVCNAHMHCMYAMHCICAGALHICPSRDLLKCAAIYRDQRAYSELCEICHNSAKDAFHACKEYVHCKYAMHTCNAHTHGINTLHMCNAHCMYAMHVCIAYMRNIAEMCRNMPKYAERCRNIPWWRPALQIDSTSVDAAAALAACKSHDRIVSAGPSPRREAVKMTCGAVSSPYCCAQCELLRMMRSMRAMQKHCASA